MPANERQIAGPALRGGGFHTEAGCQMQWSRRRSTAGDKDINMLRNDANSFSHVTKVPGTIAKSNSNVTNVRRIVANGFENVIKMSENVAKIESDIANGRRIVTKMSGNITNAFGIVSKIPRNVADVLRNIVGGWRNEIKLLSGVANMKNCVAEIPDCAGKSVVDCGDRSPLATDATGRVG